MDGKPSVEKGNVMTNRHQWMLLTALLVFFITAITAYGADPPGADPMLQSKVEAQLRLDPRLNWELLQVKIDQGQVTLFGKVASPEEMGWAETVASTVPGVKGITNNIIVDSALAPDHKVRTEIWRAMKTVPALEHNPTLNVNVRNGEVILTGAVQGEAARKAAEKAAQSVDGVRKVVNNLKVDPNSGNTKLDPSTRNPILDGERQVVP
jgi:osmotically-inducible protein OsmY